MTIVNAITNLSCSIEVSKRPCMRLFAESIFLLADTPRTAIIIAARKYKHELQGTI